MFSGDGATEVGLPSPLVMRGPVFTPEQRNSDAEVDWPGRRGTSDAHETSHAPPK